MPLERQHNSDDAMEIDEQFGEHDEHPGEDDVNMDINTATEVVPRARLDCFTASPTFAPSRPNHLLESKPSHSIVPNQISDAIVPVDIEETRPQKRFRIEQEQANAALDFPSTYKEATRSPDLDEWKKVIQLELQALQEKETWILTTKTATFEFTCRLAVTKDFIFSNMMSTPGFSMGIWRKKFTFIHPEVFKLMLIMFVF
uniref:AlNc14C25G2490 protein n=1 Tax=Albugo laibachii Nc14 TaxID=890382 RepID=F0W6K0_9STRA|nr:AlNc14C25G2490 [Albugo laibachii Nc14]|eukprot:CCA16745.1 AlNc14C25G2490 [Albugo laibachii Nc14]